MELVAVSAIFRYTRLSHWIACRVEPKRGKDEEKKVESAISLTEQVIYFYLYVGEKNVPWGGKGEEEEESTDV